MIFEFALALASVHFGVPLAYFEWVKRKWLHRPWNLRIEGCYRPKVTVIIPMHNEAVLIEDRLENLKNQSYPKEKMEIVAVDDGSTDGTAEVVRKWVLNNPDTRVKFLEEPVRRGMNPALNFALKHTSNDANVVVFTDADCEWRSDVLENATKFLSDPRVGMVTCSIFPSKDSENSLESTYRRLNNLVRVAESKWWSTPIAHGPFVAFKQGILEMIGGLPTWTGANDSAPASLIALMGYRCIATPDVVVYEYVPRSLSKNIVRRVRRAQQLIQHFSRTGRKATEMFEVRTNRTFKRIFAIEKFLHLVNPWLLVIASILLLLDYGTILAARAQAVLLLSGFFGSMLVPSLRTWMLTQLILVYASIRNLFTKELVWEPLREPPLA